MSSPAQVRTKLRGWPQPSLVRANGLIAFGLAGLLVSTLVIVAGQTARRDAIAEIRRQAQATVVLDQALLTSELDRHRATPVVLATDAAVKDALRDPRAAKLERVNVRLDLLARQTGAAAIYLLDAKGAAIAANNYRTPLSLVGTDFAYRPYFQTAIRTGADEYFALGLRTRRPGLFLTRRIGSGGDAAGVIVVKVELAMIERAWRRQAGQAMVADRDGVILLTSDPSRRFQTLAPLDRKTAERLRASRQFGDTALKSLNPPLVDDGGGVVRIGGEAFVQVRRALPLEGWSLIRLAPIAEAERASAPVRWVAGLAGVLFVVVMAWAWRSRLRRGERDAAAAEARRLLEVRVDERTVALTDANHRLKSEIEDRKRAEVRLRALQADLVQANRLAHLGQIVAGVAHEINQPVAAIRANADNALTLLSRRKDDEVQIKLTRIQSLTERIGLIVDNLRESARKGSKRTAVISVDEAIEGALILVNGGMPDDKIAVERSGEAGLLVSGDLVRLEQVLVNLLQNAFEALGQASEGKIGLEVSATERAVIIAVFDNGPGLSRAARNKLFTPFTTTKPRGLGLGLVISKAIVEGFGGTLRIDPDWRPGARFLIQLVRRPG